MGEPAGALPGGPVRVRTRRPEPNSALEIARPE
jgi:hypothetical protein